MAAPPIGCEPPEPLNTSWLTAYAAMTDGDVEALDGKVIEEICVVKRGDEWTSKFYVTEQRLLEREYRFYTELAVITAQAEQALMEACDEEESEQPILAKSVTSTSRALSSTYVPPKRTDPAVRPGVVPNLAELQANGIEGCYEVMRPRISILCSPSCDATLLGVLHKRTIIRGLAFAAADGEPWLMLHEDTLEDIELRTPGFPKDDTCFVPIAAKSLGCGDLLRRVPGRPAPGRNAWRQRAAKEPEVTCYEVGEKVERRDEGQEWTKGYVTNVKPLLVTATKSPKDEGWAWKEVRKLKDFEAWKRFTQRLLARALRLPRCLAASWKGAPESFLLVLEELPWPSWTGFDPADGCTVRQAEGAIDALAGFHSAFADPRKITGLHWLPISPLHDYAAHVETIYSDCFKEHCKLLQECMTPRAVAILDKLRSNYGRLSSELMQPPTTSTATAFTLLHGNFHPGNLRFSTETLSPKVAAYNWQFVCRGRGAYDFAMFLGLCAPPEVRAECEMELMMRYLMGRGKSGREAREEFKADVKKGLLVAFAFFFMTVASKLTALPPGDAREAIKDSIEWFASAIDDWDCDECVGGVHVPKPPKKKRKYLKKSKKTLMKITNVESKAHAKKGDDEEHYAQLAKSIARRSSGCGGQLLQHLDHHHHERDLENAKLKPHEWDITQKAPDQATFRVSAIDGHRGSILGKRSTYKAADVKKAQGTFGNSKLAGGWEAWMSLQKWEASEEAEEQRMKSKEDAKHPHVH